MLFPMYDTVSERWAFFDLNIMDNLGKGNPLYLAVPLRNNDVWFHLDTNLTTDPTPIGDIIVEDAGTRNHSFATRRMVHKRFLVDSFHEFYPLEKFLVAVNDPLNVLATTAPTDQAGALVEAKGIVGNVRAGFKRLTIHLGETLNADDVHDLSATTVQDPLPLIPDPPTDQTKPERVYLLASDGGYKRLVKSKHPQDNTVSALEAVEGTGFKFVVWNGDEADFVLGAQKTSADPKRVKYDGVETVLNGSYTNTGAVLGSFLPSNGEWSVLNVPGTNEVKMTPNGLELNLYPDLATTTPTSQVKIDKTTGNVVITAGTTVLTVTKDGDVTIDVSGGSGTQTISGNLVVNGTLTVSSDTDLNGNLTVQGTTTFGQ